MTARVGAVLLALCLLVPSSGAGQTRRTLEGIDAWVTERMQATRLPGLALAIVQNDRVVLLRGFGRASPDGTPVTSRTPFVIGSLSKAITAVAVLQLVQRRRIDLDDPVGTYLRWVQDPSEVGGRIRILHLLHHTSGFSAVDGRRFFETPSGTEAEVLRSYRELRPVRPAGEAFEYSNVNYNLLGALVERVSGEPLADFLERGVFEPLHMEHTFLDEASARAAGLAVGYRYWYGRPVPADDLPYLPGYVASAYMVSTAEDLSHFLISQLREGRYAGARVLRPASIREMQRSAVDAGEGRGQYAMGWYVTEWDGTRVVWHPGDVPNYRAAAVLAPDDGWGIAVLMNASSVLDAGGLDAIAPGVLAILEGREPRVREDRSPYVLLLGFGFLLLLLQAGRLVRWLLRLRRPWDPSRGRRISRIVIALGIDVLVAGAILALPQLLEIPFRTLLVYQPDVTLPYLAAAALAVGWCALRTLLDTLRELHE